MRADAARNLDAVLQTGARLLAEDPSTSIAAIAAEAGVDRRTVYRRFSCREALLAAVFRTKLDAIDEVFADARLEDAPVTVALHRWVEGIVPVFRRYPLDIELVRCDTDGYDRMLAMRARFDAFVHRAIAEGVIRSDLPEGMASAYVYRIVDMVANQFCDMEPAPAADIAVDVILGGIGRARLYSGART
jgi:AcrR family transcriptional regulator